MIVAEFVPILELAPCRAKHKRGFPVRPIIVGSFVFLSCIGLLLIVRLLPAPQTKQFAEEGPIQVGKFRIICTSSALCGPLPLMDVHGIGLEQRSVGTSLLLTFSIENTTDTEILSFPGLDKADPQLEDSFGNSYALMNWKGYAFAHAVIDPECIYNGTSIHPGKKKRDYLVYHPPFEKATQLRLTFSGRALGGVGTVRMLIGSDFSTFWEEQRAIERRQKEIAVDNEKTRAANQHAKEQWDKEQAERKRWEENQAKRTPQQREEDTRKWLKDHPPFQQRPGQGGETDAQRKAREDGLKNRPQ